MVAKASQEAWQPCWCRHAAEVDGLAIPDAGAMRLWGGRGGGGTSGKTWA